MMLNHIGPEKKFKNSLNAMKLNAIKHFILNLQIWIKLNALLYLFSTLDQIFFQDEIETFKKKHFC